MTAIAPSMPLSNVWSLPSALAAGAIRFYQRFISPYKGFRCAHRVCHGKSSCSEFARRVVLKRGPIVMLSLLRRRLIECSVAAQTLVYESYQARKLRKQRRREDRANPRSNECDFGGCDCVPTSSCDSPTADCGSGLDAGDFSGAADCCGEAPGACLDGV